MFLIFASSHTAAQASEQRAYSVASTLMVEHNENIDTVPVDCINADRALSMLSNDSQVDQENSRTDISHSPSIRIPLSRVNINQQSTFRWGSCLNMGRSFSMVSDTSPSPQRAATAYSVATTVDADCSSQKRALSEMVAAYRAQKKKCMQESDESATHSASHSPYIRFPFLSETTSRLIELEDENIQQAVMKELTTFGCRRHTPFPEKYVRSLIQYVQKCCARDEAQSTQQESIDTFYATDSTEPSSQRRERIEEGNNVERRLF